MSTQSCTAMSKTGHPRELMQLLPGNQKRLLRNVIGAGVVAMHQAAQLRAHHSLVTSHSSPNAF